MASAFSSELRARQTDPSNRRWTFVAYDQLSDTIGLLATVDPREAGIVVVECPAKAMSRPYHKEKLALVLANQRQFALEQAARGVAVRYVVSPGSYADALAPIAGDLGPLVVMRPAEWELRQDLAPLLASGQIVERPHDGWLTTRAQSEATGGPAVAHGRLLPSRAPGQRDPDAARQAGWREVLVRRREPAAMARHHQSRLHTNPLRKHKKKI